MLYEHWRQVASERRDRLALRDIASGRRWTFGELSAAAETISVGGSDFVFPQGHSPEFILNLLAAWRTGKVVCPLEPGELPPQIPKPPPFCVHLKSTSATTGAPRLVGFTADQLAADAENIVATMGLRPECPNLGVISMAHSYGFSSLVTPLLLQGIPLILAPSPLPEAVRLAAENETTLTLAAVPALWRAWHDAKTIPPNVRLAISAGAPLPESLERAVFEATGIKLHNFYGSTECGGITYDAGDTPRTDATCVGSPMKNVALSVAEDGCLEVRGRAVAETHWPAPDANLSSGCFHTSDLAEISDGLVYLHGRAGDQINVAGRKVSPETIERELLKHPQVLKCLVFGVPSRDAERTEEIVAVVVSREREGDLRRFVLDALPAWQAPRHWWFVEAVQTNPRGKVSRTEWRAKFLRKRNRSV